jgi:predicted Zn-dependent protease with MMP-like domain
MTQIFINEPELKTQIFETVWHEVAHYFGLDHQRIHEVKNAV